MLGELAAFAASFLILGEVIAVGALALVDSTLYCGNHEHSIML
jgi:hypothetical protein